MSSIQVIGGEQLQGELQIQGSKNAALPIIAATILNKGNTILKNCPKILDVFHMINILEDLGCEAIWEGNTLFINTSHVISTSVPEASVVKMRSSILFLGALLGAYHEVTIAYPGGCSIGKRPINYHLNAIQKMNVVQEFQGEDDNIIHCYTSTIKGNDIFLEKPSVGATQNVILASVLSEGNTRIFNAAREPEITELCNYLCESGARICGKGTSFLEIEGVKKLHDVEFTLSSDRIVAGTYMAAIAATRGDIILKKTPTKDLDSLMRMLGKTGCSIDVMNDSIRLRSNQRPQSIDLIKTQPYPGFPTDMQSQLMAVLCIADGKSTIIEDIFESRFQNANELKKMGANISIIESENKAVITGVKRLHNAVVKAPDLRGGAALVIAGLIAEGPTIIRDATKIERGYEDICRDLTLLGAKVKYCTDKEILYHAI